MKTAIFNCLPKVISDCFVFPFLKFKFKVSFTILNSLCDWSRKVTPPSQLFTCKTKTITTWSSAFSRALGSLVGFILRFHWFLVVFRFFWVAYVDVIILGLVLQHSIEKCTYQSKLKTPKVKLKHAKRLPRGMELWKYANLDRLKVLQI